MASGPSATFGVSGHGQLYIAVAPTLSPSHRSGTFVQMTTPLSQDDLDAMIARDELAGDGISVMDSLVWEDRHLLILEVIRLRELEQRLRSGRPARS